MVGEKLFLLTVICFLFHSESISANEPQIGQQPNEVSKLSTQLDMDFSEVNLNGRPFVKIISKDGTSIYLPKLDAYSAKDFDNAFCGNKTGLPMTMEIPVAKLEKPITDSITFYASVIQDVFRSR